MSNQESSIHLEFDMKGCSLFPSNSHYDVIDHHHVFILIKFGLWNVGEPWKGPDPSRRSHSGSVLSLQSAQRSCFWTVGGNWIPRDNPHRHEENMHTPHGKAKTGPLIPQRLQKLCSRTALAELQTDWKCRTETLHSPKLSLHLQLQSSTHNISKSSGLGV